MTASESDTAQTQSRFNRAWSVGALSALIPVGVVIYVLLFWQPNREAPQPETPAAETPQTQIEAPRVVQDEDVPLLPAPLEPSKPLPKLDQSDDRVLEELVALPGLADHEAWFKQDEMVRKMAIIIDSAAEGKIARKYIPLPKPKQAFPVIRQGDQLFLDPEGYQRFNLYAETFSQLDPNLVVPLYRGLSPLFEQAFGELGYPKRTFHQTLTWAIDVLLETPDTVGSLELKQNSVMYQFATPEIEQLPAIQKQLLRMGPRNVKLIKRQLRQYRELLNKP